MNYRPKADQPTLRSEKYASLAHQLQRVRQQKDFLQGSDHPSSTLSSLPHVGHSLSLQQLLGRKISETYGNSLFAKVAKIELTQLANQVGTTSAREFEQLCANINELMMKGRSDRAIYHQIIVYKTASTPLLSRSIS